MNKEEQAILAALHASTEAWNRGDLCGHLAIDDESVTSMTKSGPRQGVAPIEEAFRAAYFSEGQLRPMLKLEQIASRILSQDSAIVTGRYALYGAGQSEQAGWFTLVWLLTPSGWKVVHDHSS